MRGPDASWPPDLLVAAQLAVVDAATAEVVGALRERGVRSVLLKGPALARWLYDDAALRPYGDTDLLVAPADHAAAEQVLRELGYRPSLLGADLPPMHEPYADTWSRQGPPTAIDLHQRLGGARASAATTWSLLSAGTERLAVGGVEVEVPSVPGRLTHVALHVADHGARSGKPVDDLARALRRADAPAWAAAAQLARALDAEEPFAAGLRVLPEGRALAGRLGLAPTRSVETALKAGTAPPLAIALERLAGARGARARLRVVRALLFPSRAWVRTGSPLARRGPAGLAAAYVARLVRIGRYGPGAVVAWRRARRSVDAS